MKKIMNLNSNGIVEKKRGRPKKTSTEEIKEPVHWSEVNKRKKLKSGSKALFSKEVMVIEKCKLLPDFYQIYLGGDEYKIVHKDTLSSI